MSQPIGMIVAISQNGVIGQAGKIPWAGKYKGDLKRFKELTVGGSVIMGRKTWNSMDGKPLPDRTNIVISSSYFRTSLDERPIPGVSVCGTFKAALWSAQLLNKPIWLIGGAHVYDAGMAYADFIDVTYVPEWVDGEDRVMMPAVPDCFEAAYEIIHPYNDALHVIRWIRKSEKTS